MNVIRCSFGVILRVHIVLYHPSFEQYYQIGITDEYCMILCSVQKGRLNIFFFSVLLLFVCYVDIRSWVCMCLVLLRVCYLYRYLSMGTNELISEQVNY